MAGKRKLKPINLDEKKVYVWSEVQKTYLCNYYMWSDTSYAGGLQSQCKYLNISVCDISGKKLSIEEWYSGLLLSELLNNSTMCLNRHEGLRADLIILGTENFWHIFDFFQLSRCLPFNLFVTSKKESINSPIHQFKVQQNVF